MTNPLKKLFELCGVEVRLRRNVARVREAEKRRAAIERWSPLRRYQPRTILDIGANEGQFARIARTLCPQAAVVCFEPLADCFAALQAGVAQEPQVTAWQYALGSRNETTTIHRSEFSPSSSLLPMGEVHQREFPHTAETAPELIEVRRLDDVACELDFPSPVIAKIDVQGFECEVLDGGRETLSECAALIVELSCDRLYEGQPLFDDVYAQLKDLGFEYRGNVDQMLSPNDGRILQCDGLFENSRFGNSADEPESERSSVPSGLV